MKKIIVAIALSFITTFAFAANTPCSGKKGGISHCRSGKFVCNDGSVSRSKRVCDWEPRSERQQPKTVTLSDTQGTKKKDRVIRLPDPGKE
jgi:hypothetical protein